MLPVNVIECPLSIAEAKSPPSFSETDRTVYFMAIKKAEQYDDI